MIQKPQHLPERLLTEVELELMSIIWEKPSITVREVVDTIAQIRDLAYTSVATIMKILEKKKILKSQKSDHAHVYSPLLTREEYESTTLRLLTKNVFQNDPTTMVMRLLNESDLDHADLKAIKKLVDDRMKS
jgi:predicted transcriptional regulator